MRLVVGVAVAARVVCASDGLSGYGYTGYGVDVSFPMHHFQKPGAHACVFEDDIVSQSTFSHSHVRSLLVLLDGELIIARERAKRVMRSRPLVKACDFGADTLSR